MLDAMQRLARDDFVLLILGDLDPADAYVRELESRVRSSGLAKRVHFASGGDDLPAAYALADLVVMPAAADATAESDDATDATIAHQKIGAEPDREHRHIGGNMLQEIGKICLVGRREQHFSRSADAKPCDVGKSGTRSKTPA